MIPVDVVPGDAPLLLGLPHTGTWLPKAILDRLTPVGRTLADTDWHVDELYAGLLPGVTTVRANFHRYLIDANRGPDDASLYPGQNTTGLVPVTDFDGRPLWRDGEAPGPEEVQDRLARFHAPYHAALAAEIARVKARHGVAILFDCHSIRSEIPFLFEGTLPDFNVGTNDGFTCDPAVEASVLAACRAAAGFSYVANGRFKGGWTTRHYGHPRAGVHAIQMELAQSTYLAAEAPPWTLDREKAAVLRDYLGTMLETLADLAPSLVETA